jgi:hypothetical protein
MVELPAEFPADGAVDVFTGRRCRAAASSLTAADLLATFPVAMLVSSAKG